MRVRGISVALVLGVVALAGNAAADNAEPGKAAASQGGPRRDPKGIKGISPFWESIKKGDDAVAAHDLDAAKAAYQEAIRAEPQNAMGHYRLGELELLKGSFPDAESAWQAALRFVGENASLKAKILFVLADVKERQRSWEEETNGWNAYEAHAKAAPTAKTYPQTPPDRKKRIAEWKQLEIDYGAVKDRIKLRLEEANKKAAEDAQSPKNR
jgi:tetratricopeptide (TPR) repeat protein